MKSFAEENVFSEVDFNKLKETALEYLSYDELLFSRSYSRYYISTHFPEDIKSRIVDLANKKFNKTDLDIVYTHTVKYQIVDGVAPNLKIHTDNLPATHTLDICIETTIPEWGLNVGEMFFPDKPNSVIYLQGDEDSHWRPEYPSKDKNDYCILLLVNLAPPDHWGFKALKAIDQLPDKLKKRMSVNLIPHTRKRDR